MEKTNKITINGITVPDGTDVKTAVENGNLVITFSKESEVEKPKFKKGDVVFLNIQGDNKIYQHIIITKSVYGNRHYFYVDFCINDNDLYYGYKSMWFSKENIKSIRYATDEEKQELFNKLAKQKQLRWDEKKLKFEGIRWRAEKGEKFWFITSNGIVDYAIDNYQKIGYMLFNSRNYFQTEELANKALPKWKEFFKSLSL